MALMRAKHNVLNVVVEVPDNDYYRDKGWSKVSDDTPTTVEADLAAEGEAFVARVSYDPATHSAAEVVEAEKAGKARKSVVAAGE